MSQGLRRLHRTAVQLIGHASSPWWQVTPASCSSGVNILNSQVAAQSFSSMALSPGLESVSLAGGHLHAPSHPSLQPMPITQLLNRHSQPISSPHQSVWPMIRRAAGLSDPRQSSWAPNLQENRCLSLFSPACSHQQQRGYRSLKKSMKPINTRASRLAVQPYLPPNHQQPLPDKQLAEQAKLKAAPIVDTVLPSIPQVPSVPEYRRIGRITGEYALQLQPMFAVTQIQGTQAKLTTDDIIFVNHLKDVAVNDILALDRVMLVGSRDSTVIGRPWVPNACVLAAVEEHFKDGIVHVFKFKKRNRYKRYKQYQHALTALRILHVMTDNGLDSAQVALNQGRIPYTIAPDADQSDQGGDSEEGEEVASKS